MEVSWASLLAILDDSRRCHRPAGVQVPPSARRTVLLDLDDTLFDHTHSSLAGLVALQERFAELERLSLDQLAKIHAQNLEAMHVMVLEGVLSLDEARLARFRALAADAGA